MSRIPQLCLVENDPILSESLCDRFVLEGFGCECFTGSEPALAAIAGGRYDVVISDFCLPDMTGEDLFKQLRDRARVVPPFVFITAYGSIPRAVKLLNCGAGDYIVKPFDIEQLIQKLRELTAAEPAAEVGGGQRGQLGVSPAMRRIESLLRRLGQHREAVVLTGESGVGKEKVAQTLHRLTPGAANAPFVAVNCGALPESLLEAELFGYERGAFTGAVKSKRGYFEQAAGGTLLLDEIGEMPPSMQVKVLRAIQEKQVMRLGAERPIAVDFRLVCATNTDLKRLVEKRLFREDLYYRINVINLRIPPLRERPEDIHWLATRFLAAYQEAHPGQRRYLTAEAEAAMPAHDWPGNVRELKHCIERACILAPGPMIRAADLFEEAGTGDEPSAASEGLNAYLKDCERRYLEQALRRNGWRIGRTAGALGISRKTLWEKMGRHGIEATTDPSATEQGTGGR